MDVVDYICSCAQVPSFSTFEERLHGYIESFLSQFKNVKLVKINDNNLLVFVPSDLHKKPIAIAAHLDKINHYGEIFPEKLEVEVSDGKIVGQMDDAAGLGLCLNLIKQAQNKPFPPLLILFSEMEESTGLKHHPHLLKNMGKDVGPQIGAKRLSAYIKSEKIHPAAFITLDTTPVFKGEPGVALYTESWSRGQFEPSETLLRKLEALKTFICSADKQIRLANGTNDYLIYAEHFSNPDQGDIPSIAIEPAIFPYHQIGEGVFVDDIRRIEKLLELLLLDFDFGFSK